MSDISYSLLGGVHRDRDLHENSAFLYPDAVDVPEEWKVGYVILNLYEVKDIFEKGGMGKVYRVHHRGRNVDLAVKSPRLEILKEMGGSDNFEREAETWINLGLHPHIVSCYYVRRLGGIPRLFAQYIEGGSLADWIESRKLYEGGTVQALERMLDIAIQFAWGLNYAHKKGLIHQDVKPANLMLTTNGIAKVTDFGLARAKALVSGEKTKGTIIVDCIGMTPAYASPEQIAGISLTRRSDLWSWGMSVLEMFTGKRTWSVGFSAPEVLKSYMKSGSEDKNIPHMPDELAELLHCCFQEAPDTRPHNMREVVTIIKEIYHQIIGLNYPRPEPVEDVRLEADGLNNQGVSYRELGQYHKAREHFEKALVKERLHPQANWNLVNLNILNHSLAHPEWRDVTTKMLNDILERCGLSEDQMNKRVLLALNRKKFIYGVTMILSGHMNSINAVAFSPDGQLLASGSGIRIGDPGPSTPEEGWIGSDNTVRLWDVKSGQLIRTLRGHTAAVTSITFSPEGQLLASASEPRDNTIRLWDVRSGQLVRIMAGHTGGVTSIAFSPDGRSIASAGGVIQSHENYIVKLWDVGSGHIIKTLEDCIESPLYSVTFSPDGQLLASAGRTLKLWDVKSGEPIKTMEEAQVRAVTFFVFPPNNLILVSVHSDNTIKLWNMKDYQLINTLVHDGVTSIAVSPNGFFIASTSGSNVKLWDVKGDRAFKTLDKDVLFELDTPDIPPKSPYISIRSLAFSPDGHFLALGSSDKTVKLWANLLEPQLASLQDISYLNQKKKEREQKLIHLKNLVTEKRFTEAYQWLIEEWGKEGYGIASNFYPFFGKLKEKGRITDIISVLECWKVRDHKKRVNSVTFSPDCQFLASGNDDKTVKLWNVKSGQLIKVLEGHTKYVNSVVFSPDGQFLASASGDKTVRLWEVKSGNSINIMEGHTMGVTSLIFSPDGKFLASASNASVINNPSADDCKVRLWEVKSGKIVNVLEGHTKRVKFITYSPDGRFLVSGSIDKTIKLWDVRIGHLVETLNTHFGNVFSVIFTANSQLLALSCGDRVVDNALKLWNLRSGQLIKTFYLYGSLVRSIAFSPDDQFLASSCDDKTIMLWNLKSGQMVKTLEGHLGNVGSVAFSSDGQFLASGGDFLRLYMIIPILEFDKVKLPISESKGNVIKSGVDGVGLQLMSFQDLRSQQKSEIKKKQKLTRINELISKEKFTSAYPLLIETWDEEAFSRTSNLYLVFSKLMAKGRIKKINTVKEVGKFESHEDRVKTVTFSPDGQFIASGSWDKTVKLWDVKNGKPVKTMEGHTHYVTSVTFSPDGQFIASGSRDKTVKLWDVKNGKPVKILKGHLDSVNSVAFSPSGHLIASGSNDRTVKLWDVKNGRLVKTLEGPITEEWKVKGKGWVKTLEGPLSEVTYVTFSSDGQFLACCGGNGRIRLWDIYRDRPGKPLENINNDQQSISFSPCSRFLASGMWDRMVKLWDIRSGQLIKTMGRSMRRITAVFFSSNGQFLASISRDPTIQLWDVKSGQIVNTLKGHTHSVNEVAFSHDDQFIASASDDKSVRLWLIIPELEFD